MLAACRELGLATQTGDAIAYLKALPDESVVLVSGFHLVEHIPFPSLQTLVQEALRVLKAGGLLILETPNPENIVVATTNFYLDPTHERPIPPLLLSFVADHYGYHKVKIVRLQEPRDLMELQSPTLLDVLNGASMDYAVVAQKRTDLAKPPSELDAAFQREYGIDLRTLAIRYDQEMSGKLNEILSRIDKSAEFEARVRAATDELARMQQEFAACNADKHALSMDKSNLTAQLDQLRSELRERESAIRSVTESREAQILALTAQLDQLRSELRERESAIKSVTEPREAQILALTAQLDQLRSELRVRESAIKSVNESRQAEVVALTARLDAMQSSTSWRLTDPLRRLKRIISTR
jgi:O-antigen chain-terminating methyltransferase